MCPLGPVLSNYFEVTDFFKNYFLFPRGEKQALEVNPFISHCKEWTTLG